MSSAQSQIEIKNLWKVFGNNPDQALEPDNRTKSRTEIQQELDLVVALKDVSFNVDVGQIFVVMGLSGSGKSTLVRCLIRLIESTQGNIFVDGEDITQYTNEELVGFRRQKIAMVFQHFGLLPHRNVLDNVAYGLEVQGLSKQERFEKAQTAIDTVGLSGWESYFPDEMSGGMQQRVGLARALSVDPDILLMDEPFSGLDPMIRREMQDELVNLQTQLHKTIVFITHDLNEALKLGDRIAIMRDGEIIQEGSPEDIVANPADEYVAEFVRDVSMAKVIQAKTIMQQPNLILEDFEKPEVALDRMRQRSVDIAYFVGPERLLKGLVTRDEVTAQQARECTDLRNASVTSAVSVDAEAPIEAIIPTVANSDYPCCVVDDNGRLLGEVNQKILLTSLAESSSADNG